VVVLEDQMAVKCGNCGFEFEKGGSSDPATRKPCPKCGSTGRAFGEDLQGTIGITDCVATTLIPYYDALFTLAKELLDEGRFGVAIVVMHMACEVCVARKLSEAFKAKGIGYLEEAVEEFLNGYNLAADRNRNLFNALTGKEVHKQSFWGAFSASARRRNDIIHEGSVASQSDAEESYAATNAMLAYLKL
jgi:hypothetical protein